MCRKQRLCRTARRRPAAQLKSVVRSSHRGLSDCSMRSADLRIHLPQLPVLTLQCLPLAVTDGSAPPFLGCRNSRKPCTRTSHHDLSHGLEAPHEEVDKRSIVEIELQPFTSPFQHNVYRQLSPSKEVSSRGAYSRTLQVLLALWSQRASQGVKNYNGHYTIEQRH